MGAFHSFRRGGVVGRSSRTAAAAAAAVARGGGDRTAVCTGRTGLATSTGSFP